MELINGANVWVSTDSSGRITSVDWACPNCSIINERVLLSQETNMVDGDGYVINKRCKWCTEEAILIFMRES